MNKVPAVYAPGNLLSYASRSVHMFSLCVVTDPVIWEDSQQEAGVLSEPVQTAEGLSLLRLDGGGSPSEPEVPESVHLVTWTRICAIMLCRGAAAPAPAATLAAEFP